MMPMVGVIGNETNGFDNCSSILIDAGNGIDIAVQGFGDAVDMVVRFCMLQFGDVVDMIETFGYIALLFALAW